MPVAIHCEPHHRRDDPDIDERQGEGQHRKDLVSRFVHSLEVSFRQQLEEGLDEANDGWEFSIACP